MGALMFLTLYGSELVGVGRECGALTIRTAQHTVILDRAALDMVIAHGGVIPETPPEPGPRKEGADMTHAEILAWVSR
jgi:hypothetical protein